MHFRLANNKNNVVLEYKDDDINYDIAFFELEYRDGEYLLIKNDTGEILIQFTKDNILYYDQDYYIEMEV